MGKASRRMRLELGRGTPGPVLARWRGESFDLNASTFSSPICDLTVSLAHTMADFTAGILPNCRCRSGETTSLAAAARLDFTVGDCLCQ